MIVEVIAVGTELLIGQRVNTNAAHIAERLTTEGLDAHYQVVVGDNQARIAAALTTALDRADAVILTGGIGPTHDDLTREAICQATGRAMVRDREHASWIADRVQAQGRRVSANQLRMADLPEAAEGIPNVVGVALGIVMDHEGHLVFALPGVPPEMTTMLEETVIPRLRAAGGPSVIRSRVIKIWGPGESTVSRDLADLATGANPSLGLLIKDMEVHVRISAKASDWEAAGALIEPVESEVVTRLAGSVFGYDEDTVESLIATMLADRSWTISTVERATLGQAGARLAVAAGASFRGAVVPGSDGGVNAPEADVVLEVGPVGRGRGRRLTRPVEMTVSTPQGTTTEVFQLGGGDSALGAYATSAGLHVIRLALAG